MVSEVSSAVKNTLIKEYAYRNQQIEKIVDHLCGNTVSPEPLLVTGPESTGKTSILRKALDATGSLYVYIECRETSSPKAVYSVIVRKLKRALDRNTKRKRGRTHVNRGDSMSQFVTQIGDVLKNYEGGTVWIVLDSAERVAKDDVLITLSQLGEVLSADVGIIMVSTMPWVSGVFSTGRGGDRMREPDVIEFPAYTASEICKICIKKGYSPRCTEYKKYYEQFVSSVVPVLFRGTNNLLDIRVALSKLWPVYIGPVRKQGKSARQGPQLLRDIMPMLQNIVSNLDVGVDYSTSATTAKDREMGNQAKMLLAIPYMSKFLLLASYIASRNKATSDQAIFDPGYSGKSRKNSQAMDRQAERALDKKLRGSHVFPLERMLNIYYYICEPKSGNGFIPKEEHVEWLDKLQEVEVLMQVTSLCSLGLLTCVGGDPLTGPSYRCDLSDDLAYKIARNLKVSLNDYIKLA